MKWSNNCNAMFNDGCYFCFGYVWLDWGVGGLMGGGGGVCVLLFGVFNGCLV